MKADGLFNKAIGAAAFTVAAANLLWRKYGPTDSEITDGMAHFKKGAAEFQKGIHKILFRTKADDQTPVSFKIKVE